MNQSSRRESRPVSIGKVQVGGGAPVTVQTMTKTDTRNVEATSLEIIRLSLAGCDIIRLAVPDMVAAEALFALTPRSPIPIIADIHFDHILALKALEAGVHGLRINPGNIRDKKKTREIVRAALDRKVPIRIGVNAGSLDPNLKARYGGIVGEALAESALNEVSLLEKEGFHDIKIAVKAFDIPTTLEATRIVAKSCQYPIHLGITESGLPEEGIIRSSIGIGALLLEGIGDTIRVSLTADSSDEVETGIRILRALGIREEGLVIVSCPTCGRCQVPLMKMAREVSKNLKAIKAPLRIAVMGCAVNGPGEARDADFGIAGGKDSGLIFKKGKVIKSLPAADLVEGLLEEINCYLKLPELIEAKNSINSQIEPMAPINDEPKRKQNKKIV